MRYNIVGLQYINIFSSEIFLQTQLFQAFEEETLPLRASIPMVGAGSSFAEASRPIEISYGGVAFQIFAYVKHVGWIGLLELSYLWLSKLAYLHSYGRISVIRFICLC